MISSLPFRNNSWVVNAWSLIFPPLHLVCMTSCPIEVVSRMNHAESVLFLERSIYRKACSTHGVAMVGSYKTSQGGGDSWNSNGKLPSSSLKICFFLYLLFQAHTKQLLSSSSIGIDLWLMYSLFLLLLKGYIVTKLKLKPSLHVFVKYSFDFDCSCCLEFSVILSQVGYSCQFLVLMKSLLKKCYHLLEACSWYCLLVWLIQC